MGETSYGVVRERMNRDRNDAENYQSQASASRGQVEERQQAGAEAVAWASRTGEEMQVLKVDGRTLGAMGTHLDEVAAAKAAEDELAEALTRVQQTWGKVMETAQVVNERLVGSGHASVQDARDNAAGGGADREFYQSD